MGHRQRIHTVPRERTVVIRQIRRNAQRRVTLMLPVTTPSPRKTNINLMVKSTASGEAGIQQMILAGGPVETAFTVYSELENYDGGIYQHITGEQVGGHAVKIVGWGVECGIKHWKVASSWNPYWAEDGYFWILRGTNHCGMEDHVVGTSPDSKWHKGVTPSTACEDQETQDACKALPCTWCYIEYSKMGFCKRPDVKCNTTVSSVVV